MDDDDVDFYGYVRALDERDEFRRLVVRLTLKLKRNRISKAASLRPNATIAEKLNRKRFARSQSVKLRRRILGASHPPIAKHILAAQFAEHPVLESFCAERAKQWRPIPRRQRNIAQPVLKVPRLSFLDAPAEAMSWIAEMVKVESYALNVRLDFDFEHVEDIGPFLLMSEIWPYFAPVFTEGGRIFPSVAKVLEAVGLRRALRMNFPTLTDTQDVWAMPVQRRRATGRSRAMFRYLDPQTDEITAGRLVDEIDGWLAAAGTNAQLTAEGRLQISQIVTELLNNAERHSSYVDKDGSWTVAAFMARREIEGEIRHVCHIAFLSIGATICESLEATAPDDLRPKIETFVHMLRRAGASQSRETLLTLCAIQDGVTRDPDAYARRSGGYGFMEFVDSVNVLGLSMRPELRPKMAIISGRSCITLRDDYIQGKKRDEDTPGRKLLFNPSNTTDEPPDVRFVQDLPIKFPGTVISVAFTLDQDFYKATLNGNDRIAGTDEGRSEEP